MKYRQSPRVAARVIEGMASVVTSDDNKLHTLNKSATLIWGLAVEGCTIDEMAALLVESYEVEAETARADAEVIAADLVQRGIFEAIG